MKEDDEVRLGSLQARGSALKSILAKIHANKLPPSCCARILKVVRGELNFVGRLCCGSPTPEALCSSNFGHLEAIVQVLQHPLVHGICAVMQRFPSENSNAFAHVDLVGFYDSSPAWFVVSDRNPKHLTWDDNQQQQKGIKSKTLLLVQAAFANRVVRPSCIIFVFAKGISDDIAKSLEEVFQAVKLQAEDVESGEWILVGNECSESNSTINSSNNNNNNNNNNNSSAVVMFRIDLATPNSLEEWKSLQNVTKPKIIPPPALLDAMFYSILRDIDQRWGYYGQQKSECEGLKMVNLDTTALMGIVSGISNGRARYLLYASSQELEKKFSEFVHFFKKQATLELEKPFLREVANIFKQKAPLICEFAWEEFEKIFQVIGGPDEKRRAHALHDCLKPFIVGDMASERMLALEETGKIKGKHKIVFGTGDRLYAPTLTSNMSFVRAVVSKGMAISFIQHRPLALTKD